MKDYLEYTEDALLNRVLFMASANDLNIFVEDQGKQFEYQIIFQRLLGDKYRVNKIFPMNGKEGVRKALDIYGNDYEGKSNFYLVDGDFDLILNKNMINAPNYIYLERYNIESYLIDKKAVVLYMAGKLKKIQEETEREIEYDLWHKDTYEKFERLFLAYVVGQSEIPEEKNVGNSSYSFLLKNGLVDISKIEQYENDLEVRIQNFREILENYKEKYRKILEEKSERLICGKYVLSCLVHYLRIKTSKRIKEDDFKYFLLTQFNIENLNFIKERIDSVLKSYS